MKSNYRVSGFWHNFAQITTLFAIETDCIITTSTAIADCFIHLSLGHMHGARAVGHSGNVVGSI